MGLKNLTPAPEWTGPAEWATRRGTSLSWPKPVTTLGGVLLSKSSGEETLYALQRAEPERAPHLASNKEAIWQWVAQTTSQHTSSPPLSLWPAGPEDAVFEHLATLKKALGDQQNVTANVSGQLQAHTQHTVAHAFGEAANGEDQAHTVEEVQARWDRLVQRWERQISDSETLQAWQQQCTTLLDNCAPLLSTTPSPKRPKP